MFVFYKREGDKIDALFDAKSEIFFIFGGNGGAINGGVGEVDAAVGAD